MESFEKELQCHFKFKLENRHVIDMDQIMVSILSKGSDGNPLNFSYKSRQNDQLQSELAMILKRVSQSTKGGILVFF